MFKIQCDRQWKKGGLIGGSRRLMTQIRLSVPDDHRLSNTRKDRLNHHLWVLPLRSQPRRGYHCLLQYSSAPSSLQTSPSYFLQTHHPHTHNRRNPQYSHNQTTLFPSTCSLHYAHDRPRPLPCSSNSSAGETA